MTQTGRKPHGDGIQANPMFANRFEVTTLVEYAKKSFDSVQDYSTNRQHGDNSYPILSATQPVEHTSTKTNLILLYPLAHLLNTYSSSTKLKPSPSVRMSNFRHLWNESTICTTRKKSEMT